MNKYSSEQQKRIAVLKRVFHDDIEEFGKYFFPHHSELQTPEFHREIYTLYEGEEKRIALGAPRGHAKSTITDLIYLSWAIVHTKAQFVLLISDTHSQAVLFLDTLKAELESNEKLKAFYGDLTSNDWSESEITTNGIKIKALGAGMKVRGLKYRQYRPDLVIVDDLENDELVESKARREKLERWFNGALVPSMAKDGRIIVIGTILHYDALLAKLLDPNQYTEYYKKTYRAINDEGALWESHLTLAQLNAIKDEYIQKGQGFLFYAEYQNDPVSSEYQKFKYEKIQFYNDDSLKEKNLNTYLLIDRAYSTENTADFTGIIVLSVDQENNWYVRIAERLKGEEKDLIDKIFYYVSHYGIKQAGIEQKAFLHTLKPTLDDEMRKRNQFFTIDELKDGGRAKELRIEGLLPRYESGSIYFLPEQKDLIDELIRFPKAAFDDLSDALSYGLNMAKSPTGGMDLIQDPYYGQYGTCVR